MTPGTSSGNRGETLGDNRRPDSLRYADGREAAGATARPRLSVFLPVYNEAESLPRLHAKILDAMREVGESFEVIYVDDGSRDDSLKLLASFAHGDARVKVISFRRNYGQTAAMAAGIEAARGDILIPMDADLQNDPADIGRLLKKLDEGYDVVSGWRADRKDAYLIRVLPARAANWLISRVSGVRLHDYGCSLKAYRREVLQDVKLYGEMHRFIPVYASWAGARVTEIPVTHHARAAGKSKYGLSRTVKVLFDLLTVKFMASYWTKPMYLFGWVAVTAFAAAFICATLAALMNFAGWPVRAGFGETPLVTVAAVLFALGIQLLLTGLIAEIGVRTYHEAQGKRPYAIRTRINFGADESEGR
jgi:glycosyltransferase involved in cell wall biosynthesis